MWCRGPRAGSGLDWVASVGEVRAVGWSARESETRLELLVGQWLCCLYILVVRSRT